MNATITISKPNKVNVEPYSLFVECGYDQYVVDKIRTFPQRSWDSSNKSWELPISKIYEVINMLNKYDITITSNYENVFDSLKPMNSDIKYSFKTEPFSHQIDGFNFGMTHSKWLLADEQGLGKTKQVIDIACALKEEKNYKHCLIICGVNGLKWNWKNEINTHSDESGWILGQRNTNNGKVKIGSTKDKMNDLNDLPSDYFLITNVESLRDTDIATKIATLCKNGDIGLVAIDEIHKCKNPTSQQGKGILKVNADYKIAMTGTPIMNNPLDLYVILKWLGYESHSFYSFKQYYCEMGGFGGYEIIGYKHMDNLQNQLKDIMLRRLKEDVLDLPDKLFINEYVELTPKQNQLYKEVLNDITMNIDNIKMSSNPLAQLIRLRQTTGYTGILSSSIQESAKLDRMEELVDEAVSNGKKVVIFSNWTQMTHVIEDRLKRYNRVVITGETKDSDRQIAVDRFQNDDNCKVIIGTIGAMGTGLTLTAGTVEIFVDEPWTMANKDQAIDRCHRIGAKSNVTIYTLICKNTIDERINELVAKKGKLASSIVDGKIVGNKSELLDYLLS